MPNHLRLLRHAARSAEEGRWGDALNALLEAWRARRSARLADLVQALAEHADTSPEACRMEPGRDLHERWLAVAGRHQPAELGWLLRRLTDGGKVTASEERARLLPRFGDDPRLARQLCVLLRAMPLRTNNSRPFWEVVLELVEQNGDSTCLPALEHARDAPAVHDLPDALGSWLTARAADVKEVLRGRDEPALTPEEADAYARIAAALGPEYRAKALLVEILDRPQQDEPRLAYAELLKKLGDPHGEFIELQYRRYRGTATPGDLEREWGLFRAHHQQWLGRLAPVVDSRGFNRRRPMEQPPFERGFLARCHTKPPSAAALQQVLGDPLWSTVEELVGYDAPARLVLQPGMLSLRSAPLWLDSLPALAALTSPPPLQNLTAWGFSVGLAADELSLLLACGPNLPRLSALELRGAVVPDRGFSSLHPRAVQPLLDDPLGHQLRQLTIAVAPDMIGEWWRYVDQTNLETLVLELPGRAGGWRLHFGRGASEELEQLSLGPREPGSPPHSGVLIEALQTLAPERFTRIELSSKPDAALRRALQPFSNATITDSR